MNKSHYICTEINSAEGQPDKFINEKINNNDYLPMSGGHSINNHSRRNMRREFRPNSKSCFPTSDYDRRHKELLYLYQRNHCPCLVDG